MRQDSEIAAVEHYRKAYVIDQMSLMLMTLQMTFKCSSATQ